MRLRRGPMLTVALPTRSRTIVIRNNFNWACPFFRVTPQLSRWDCIRGNQHLNGDRAAQEPLYRLRLSPTNPVKDLDLARAEDLDAQQIAGGVVVGEGVAVRE